LKDLILEGKSMPEVGSPLEIIERVREDTALFEDPLPWYLNPCTLEDVERIFQIKDPILFAAEVYNLVRRVEAAAAKHARENEPRVREAAAAVKRLEGPIMLMEQQVRELTPKTPLEEAGKTYLLDRFLWAQAILNERLQDWGY
jgi:hypothetical protein